MFRWSKEQRSLDRSRRVGVACGKRRVTAKLFCGALTNKEGSGRFNLGVRLFLKS